MRLYSAAEHLAEGIRMMRSLPSESVRGRGSQWERVRRFLQNNIPADPLVFIMNEIRRNRSWRLAMAIRGAVVHDQPPRVAGQGHSYDRKRRWRADVDGSHSLIVGAPDPPERTVVEGANIVIDSMAVLTEALAAVVDEYYALLAGHGIHETSAGLSIPAADQWA